MTYVTVIHIGSYFIWVYLFLYEPHLENYYKFLGVDFCLVFNIITEVLPLEYFFNYIP